MQAFEAADILGINRTRTGDLRPMVKALRIHSFCNTKEENKRLEAAKWALKNWKAYKAECNKRRNNRGR